MAGNKFYFTYLLTYLHSGSPLFLCISLRDRANIFCVINELIMCGRHILYSYKITFWGITPANRNRLGRNFTEIQGHVARPVQTFVALCQTDAIWHRKNAFCEVFVRETTHCFTHFLADDFREILTQNVNQCCHENFWNIISIFFWRGSFSRKKLILGVLGVHLRRARSSLDL